MHYVQAQNFYTTYLQYTGNTTGIHCTEYITQLETATCSGRANIISL